MGTIEQNRATGLKKMQEKGKEFENHIKNDFLSEYILLEPYKGTRKSVKAKCLNCNDEIKLFPETVFKKSDGYLCKTCLKNRRDQSKYNSNIKKGKHDNRPYPEKCYDATNGLIEPIEEYIDSRTKIYHRCTVCNHEWRVKPNNILNSRNGRGTGCPECNKKIKTVSNGENDVTEYIKSIYDGIILENDRSIISPKELDIYIPELKLAVEYCGLFWHNEDHKGIQYHYDKCNECMKKGIRLITIFEDEWIHNADLVKYKLDLAIGNKKDVIDLSKFDIEISDYNDKLIKFIANNSFDTRFCGNKCAVIKNNDEIYAVLPFNDEYMGEIVLNDQYYFKNTTILMNSTGINKISIDLRWNNYIKYINKYEFKCCTEPDFYYSTRNDGTIKFTEDKLPDNLDSEIYKIYDCGRLELQIKG